MSCGYGIENEICCCNSKYIKISGDTIIETLHYKRIFESTDSLKENWQQIGYIREEYKKVFARKKDDLTEGLIYDFNININDTLTIKNPFSLIDSINMVVTSIDSINILNGKRKRITLTNKDYYEEYWIEGIGSLMGVTNSSFYSVGGFKKLLCFWYNNQLQYSNPEYDYCFFTDITSIQTSQKWKGEIIVYPNPVNNILNFSVNERMKNQPINLKLFDCSGQIIYSNSLMGEYSLDLSEMASGLYFFSLTSFDKGVYKNGKIIKR